VFVWDGARQSVVLETPLAIASFGEDEQGEILVVDLGGGIHRIVASTPDASALTVVEYVHAGVGHYFATAAADEISKLDAGVFSGWSRTGESFRAHAAGTPGNANVCRFLSTAFAGKASHFLTPVADECAAVNANPDWLFEGEVLSMALPDDAGDCPAGTKPLYRLYNEGQGGAPNHRYTTRLEVRTAMLVQRWKSEGSGGAGVIGCVPL
jgi:hypothetical protein